VKYLLDTDVLTLLERGGADSLPLQLRLAEVPAADVGTTVVNYEEKMRGWLARAAQANTPEKLVAVYARLLVHIETFAGVPILPFDEAAAAQFELLRRARVRIGTMDLKIAAVALAMGATVLTRNVSDFSKVPSLRFEDWSS
jgi:tRNA(fMet)-specific endonuclease VapC